MRPFYFLLVNREYLIYCRSGNRSGQAFQLMQDLGFQTVYNMLGGMNSWNASGYPVTDEIPAYVNIYASVTSSIEIETNTKIDIYPNPVTNLLTIKSSLSLHEYIVVDKVGKIVLRDFLQNNKINVTEKITNRFIVKR